MAQNNTPAPPLTLALAAGGKVLACSPQLAALLGADAAPLVSISQVVKGIQPQMAFLSMLNAAGSGYFTIGPDLFEISVTKDGQGTAEIVFRNISDAKPMQAMAKSQALHIPQNFDFSSLPELLLDALPGAESAALLVSDGGSQPYRFVATSGYARPSHLANVLLGQGSVLADCLNTASAQVHPQLNLFSGYLLDGGSIFEYRSATGGRLPQSAVTFPVQLANNQPAILLAENYREGNAFDQAILPQVIEALASAIALHAPPAAQPDETYQDQFQALDSVLAMLDRADGTAPTAQAVASHLRFLVGYDAIALWQVIGPDGLLLQQPIGDELGAGAIEPQPNPGLARGAQLHVNLSGSEPVAQILPTGSRSAITVPVRLGSDEPLLFCLAKESPVGYNAADLNTVSIYARVLAQRAAQNIAASAPPPRQDQELAVQNQKRISQNNAIWEALVDGVLVTDSINRVQYTNKALARFLDLSRGFPGESTIESAAQQLHGSLAGWKETITKWSIQPELVRPSDVYEEQVKLNSGRVLSIHLSPVLWGKEFLGTVTVFRDVSYEFEFDRLKSDFITSISHELRTPLTSIQGYVDLLLMGVTGDLSEEQRGFMSIVKSNSERLNNLINDMLELTTIEAGKANLSIHPTDIFTLAQEVLDRYRERSVKENKQVEFYLESDQTIPLVMADPERARQILDNLMSNAYTFSQTDGKIIISLKKADDALQVDITDTGIGIAKEHKDLIFDQFTWVDHPGEQSGKGIGLGLPIVKQLVEMQNGRIWVESSGIPGEGATFSFTLPIKAEV